MNDLLDEIDILNKELKFLEEKGVIYLQAGTYRLNQDFIVLLENIKKLTCVEDIP